MASNYLHTHTHTHTFSDMAWPQSAMWQQFSQPVRLKRPMSQRHFQADTHAFTFSVSQFSVRAKLQFINVSTLTATLTAILCVLAVHWLTNIQQPLR